MNKISLALILLFCSSFIFGQVDQIEIANNTIKERGEVYFKFELDDDSQSSHVFEQLSKQISIDKVVGNKVTAYANEKEFTTFISSGLDFEVLTPPSMMYPSILENSKYYRDINSWDYYPNWDEYNTKMNQFVTSYPNLCELVTIGTSNNGREIMCIHINNNLGVDQNEPEFLYTSSIHGDELVGYVLTLRLISYLLDNYGIDADVTTMVDNIDIWINPLANPDGTFAGGNNSVWGATRGNSNNIDLNRNFEDPEDGQHPDGNAWQTETLIMMDFAENHDFVMSSNMHGGSEVVNYPWDTWPRYAADDDWWQYVSREYADLVHENGWQGYFTDLNNGITNGYAWYSISGGRQDYMNYFHNCREMTLELSTVKTPPESQLNDFWDANYKSLLAYMMQVTNGFSGIVTNAVTGNPIQAMVYIDGHELDNSEVYSHQPIGDYHRPIKEGSYDVTFSSFGYYDKTVNVTVSDDDHVELNVELLPLGTLISEFSSTATIAGPASSIDFFDHSLGNNIVSREWYFEGGNPETSTEVNPIGIVYNNIGEFDVELKITDGSGATNIKFIEDYIVIKEAVVIENTSVTVCDAVFYDTGAENDNYSDNEDFVITFYPEVQDMQVILDFIEFDIENHFYCDNDFMEIYDGENTDATIIGDWCGTDSPGRVYATNEVGALTVLFHSNTTITRSGWKAVVSCDSNVGVIQNTKLDFSLFPNPAKDYIQLSYEREIANLKIHDLMGKVLYESKSTYLGQKIDINHLESSSYILSFMMEGKIYNKKFIVVR